MATYTKKGEIVNGSKGGWVEYGIASLDAASIAAGAQGIETIPVPGAKIGDLVFVNCEAPVNRLAVVGASVTATDVVSVYLNNMYDATTAVDQTVKNIDLLIVHFSTI
jgi:hypothetical protein